MAQNGGFNHFGIFQLNPHFLTFLAYGSVGYSLDVPTWPTRELVATHPHSRILELTNAQKTPLWGRLEGGGCTITPEKSGFVPGFAGRGQGIFTPGFAGTRDLPAPRKVRVRYWAFLTILVIFCAS